MSSGWLHHQLKTNSKDENKENREKKYIYKKNREKRRKRQKEEEKTVAFALCIFFLNKQTNIKIRLLFRAEKRA
jgi:hypothetical protein